MNVTCNGCEKTFPFNDTLLHDQQCDTHAHRELSGWGKCTHEASRCYRNAEAPVTAADLLGAGGADSRTVQQIMDDIRGPS